MWVLSSTHGSRGDVQPLVGLAVQLRALGAPVRAFVPPDRAATSERDVPVAAGVMPNGVWR
jgi:vancomycin aglycone glucosyltransferase